MVFRHLKSSLAFGLILCTTSPLAFARDIKLTIPRNGVLTPVQRLNREGVEAVVKHRYEKAETLFYKAYLYDPSDPFTLNNLGYVAELQGQLDQAEKMYKLAAEQGCYAIIDRSDATVLKGKPMLEALGTLKNTPMHLNRVNVLGIELLAQERPFEAETLLREALALDPHNPFTLNNLGVAEEATGDLETALTFYDQAAATRSQEQIVIALKKSWRGKPVSEMAAESARDLRARMQKLDMTKVHADMLAIRGVSALNRNDWEAARKAFLEAYPTDPQSAFALNNRAYVAERDGDPEMAKVFYAAARKADDAGARVGSASQPTVDGQPLEAIAGVSVQKVGDELDAYSQSRHGQKGQTELKRRDGRPAELRPPTEPSSPEPSAPPLQ